MSNQSSAASRNGFDMAGGALKKASVIVRAKYLTEGQEIRGIFENVNPSVGKFKKPAMFLTLTEPLTYSDPKNAEKTYQPGESVGLNVCGNLGKLVAEKSPTRGDEVLIIYSGKDTIKNPNHEFTGEEAHNFEFGVKRAASATAATLPE